MLEVIPVKLGGSLITDKRRAGGLRPAVVARLAREIVDGGARSRRRLLIGHGGGSFGHVAARRYGLNRGPLPRGRLPGIPATQERMGVLHQAVTAALTRAGGLPFSLAPSSFLAADAGRPVSVRTEPLRLALDLGLLPVVFGDVVLDRSWGASICSTETVFLALARHLRRCGYKIRRVLWLGATEGVLDAGGNLLARLSAAEARRGVDGVGGAAGTDVTGGMAHRLRAAAALTRLGIASWILDGRVPGRLRQALAGRNVPGTRVEP